MTSSEPSAARALSGLPGRQVELSWTNPPVSAFATGSLLGVRVVRRERTFPAGPGDGALVHAETDPIVDRLTDTGLTPLTRYYYTVFAYDGTTYHTGDGSRAAALATDDYGLADTLYRLLPAVHQRDDVPLRPDEVRALDPRVREALRVLPAGLRDAGQLRRYLAAAFAPAGLMRSTAEALRQLHDVDRVGPEYLPLLAAFLDWRTDRTLPVYAQRNEVRAAPRLYRTVGTVGNLRSIVTRYTGRRPRIAEYGQHLARAGHAPQLNVFALRESGGGWLPTADAADVLGLAPTGGGAGAATVTGTAAEPFALAPGRELTVATDADGPVTARFARSDAADLGAATAAEVAAALNRQFSGLTATAVAGGKLRLDAHEGTLRVELPGSSLVTLDSAPRGRLSAVPAGDAAFRLFHAVADPLGAADNQAARRAAAGNAFPRPPVPGELGVPVSTPAVTLAPRAAPAGEIRVEPYRGGRWGDSAPLFPGGEPAAAALAPGRILLAWIDRPGAPDARILASTGTTHDPGPAVLTGRTGTPFALPDGSFLLIRDGHGRARGTRFARTDFADPVALTVGEVATVLTTRLGGLLTASAAPGGALRLTSVATGGDARLEVDLASSTAAAALGFGPDDAVATGDWGDAIAWGDPQPLTAVPPGRLADLAAAPDAATGAVRLAYARHDGTAWQVRTVRFDGAAWTGDEALTSGPLSSREPALARDGDGRVWAVWARQGAPGAARWSLRQRNRAQGATAWTAEAAVTSVPAPDTAGDREPAITARPGLAPRVFFRSDRGGGADLWSVPVGGAAVPVTTGAPADAWPAPVTVGGAQWLLHRSDRSVGYGTAGDAGAPDTGTVRRHAGSTTVVLGDAARIGGLRGFDDLVAYTPQRPAGDLPRDDEVYTRGTVGLYLDDEPAAGTTARLDAVLRRFLPINVRAVLRRI